MVSKYTSVDGICAVCGNILPIPRHWRTKYCCDKCRLAGAAASRCQENIKRLARERWAGFSEQEREHERQRGRQYNARLKLEVIGVYGGACECCGASNIEFLAIDHIAGGGNRHRKDNYMTAGKGTYIWLKRNNYPQGFRVLCHNCNHSIGQYGYCPHQK